MAEPALPDFSPQQLPPPPPPAPVASLEPTGASQAIFAALMLLFFAKPWLAVVEADLLACALFSLAACAAAASAAKPGLRQKLIGHGAFLALLGACAAFAARQGLPVLRLELKAAAGLGLLLGLAGLYLGFWSGDDDEPDMTACGLVAAGGALLVAVAVLLRLPAQQAWRQSAPELLSALAASFLTTQGPVRWASLPALYLGALVFFPRKQNAGRAARVVNWNT